MTTFEFSDRALASPVRKRIRTRVERLRKLTMRVTVRFLTGAALTGMTTKRFHAPSTPSLSIGGGLT